jgi:azurin
LKFDPYLCKNFFIMKMIKYVMIAGIVSLTACGSGDESSKKAEQPSEEPKTETPAQEQPAAEADVAVLEITGNDIMRYDKTELRAKAGQKVKLTLHHAGKLAKEAMGHNIVILKPGTDIAAFTAKAIDAKATDYVPESEAGSIIAHSKLIGGGESTTIEFTAPAAGTYPFICSFPGHSAFMKGDFIVE